MSTKITVSSKFLKPRISKSGMFKLKKDKVVLACKVTKKEFNPIERSWVVAEVTHEDIPVEQLGFKKEVVGNMIFMREGLSMATLKTYVGYFVQKVRIAIPKNRRNLKYSYLYVSTAQGGIRGTNPLHIRHFAHGCTASLSQGDIEANEIIFQKIGKPKRITEATKRKLILQDDFLGLYKDEALTKELIEV